MIVVCKKRKLLLCGLLVAIAIGSSGAGYQVLKSKGVFLQSVTKTVIIDAGHDAHREYYKIGW